jgi:hypothetical protein
MTPVYIAESELDAQLVQDLLVSAGIAAHVFGPNVAGSHPGVPATPQIRVVVEDGEAIVARALIQDWQTGPELDDEDSDEDDALFEDRLPLERDA